MTALLIKKNNPTNDTLLETFYSRDLKQNVLIKKQVIAFVTASISVTVNF